MQNVGEYQDFFDILPHAPVKISDILPHAPVKISDIYSL